MINRKEVLEKYNGHYTKGAKGMNKKITARMHPYLVVEIENNPLPMDFDVYYLSAETSKQATDLIGGIVDSLEVNDEPVKFTVRFVELNDEQHEYI